MSNSLTFTADRFTPTKWSTAEQKADFANKLLAFIRHDFPQKKFTETFYSRLCNCFGFIAHNGRHGFFTEYFTSTEDKLRFLEQVADAPCHGSPDYTFSDVECEVREAVRALGWVSVYATRLAQQNESDERNLLPSLQAKYQGASTPVMPIPPCPVRLNPQQQGTQFSLFG